ncbi:TetR/AcrR family transcriptional regulator [Erwinia sorbitola]|uniref:TetR family transcriptional regulator n=1 Tax=Erwinia sorbitola TaxID=2681984 RepID=A0A6I6EH82_9GAMM|nr:TetR/AcrR family transcriptional regulator [Erwinia sorbitola]QGU85891.1 TetR family transcriptional regulator [Erwinia sorbitola]
MSTDKSSTWHRLINAAAKCFSEKGFNGASIGDIARQAEVSQGAMYTWFKGKSALISAIVEEEKNTALLNYSQPYSGSPFERICQLVKSCINDVGYPADHRLWVEIIAEAARNDEVKATFMATDLLMRNGIKTIIQDGIEKGEFDRQLEAESATIAIYALIDGLISRKAINPEFDLETQLPTLDGILKFILKAT